MNCVQSEEHNQLIYSVLYYVLYSTVLPCLPKTLHYLSVKLYHLSMISTSKQSIRTLKSCIILYHCRCKSFHIRTTCTLFLGMSAKQEFLDS